MLYALRERGGSVLDRAQQMLERLEAEREMTGARRAEAERELAKAQEAVARVKRDYTSGDITAAEWRELKVELEADQTAAEAQQRRLAEREAELAAQLSDTDLREATLAAMASLHDAVSAALADAEGIERVRALLRAIFPAVTVRRVGDDFHLDPGEPGDLSALLEGTGPSPTIEGLGLTTV